MSMTDAERTKMVDAIRMADALVVTAGAGMGVDSGLPDFRGTQGFWKAYPPFAKLGLRFEELANPRWFHDDPTLAWGFYGHRLMTYRSTVPHFGFAILKRWASRKKRGCFVYTSNVDGAFQKAGLDTEKIVEVHGSIHHLQCMRSCGVGIFSADSHQIEIDADSIRAVEPLPKCPNCGALARPNILMFGDGEWEEHRSFEQELRMAKWLRDCHGTPRARIVALEFGAGTAVPTVRIFSERLVSTNKAFLVRVNVREPDTRFGIGVACGAKDFLEDIDRQLEELSD